MAKDLSYVEAVKKRNLECFMYSNGQKQWNFMKSVIDAGIDYIRFNVVGYNRENTKVDGCR